MDLVNHEILLPCASVLNLYGWYAPEYCVWTCVMSFFMMLSKFSIIDSIENIIEEKFWITSILKLKIDIELFDCFSIILKIYPKFFVSVKYRICEKKLFSFEILIFVENLSTPDISEKIR